jgi:formylglycine-generating enzyme required for sulfatase activity
MQVFFSYSHKDKEFHDALVRHLTPLQQEGKITTWHDQKIMPGDEWEKAIESHLESADIILLLISVDFVNSQYCYDIELKKALQRHEKGEARVIPVILRSVDWHNTPFGKLNALPTDGKAITLWSDRDAAFTNVAIGLRGAIEELCLLPLPQDPLPSSEPQPPSSDPAPPQNSPPSPKPRPLVTDSSRRKFLQLLVWGSSGGLGVLVFSQLFKPQIPSPSPDPPPSRPIVDDPKFLKKISFTSVRLGNSSQILERPVGSAMMFTEELAKGVAMNMVKIPAGKFTMGSPTSEKDRQSDESPQHLVTVPEFYCGQTLVTQAQWQAIMGNNPSEFKGNDKLPVDSVSWLDAMGFCEKLSQKTGRAYRLPSEAEWEYACRAGTQTPFAFGETITPAVVNYNGNFPYASAAKGEYRAKTTPVGIFPANGFGLYDMHGNLWEWCLDEWVDNYNNSPTNGSAREGVSQSANNSQRLLRGGSWEYGARNCRSAYRNYSAESNRINLCGLRVVAVASSTPSRQNF